MKKWFVLFILLCYGCKNVTHKCIIKAQDLLKSDYKKVHPIYSGKNNLVGISDNGYDGGKGGAYYFYPDGKLQFYRFFQTDSAYNFQEKYDRTGNVLKTIGSPFVDARIREVNLDSAFFVLCFFSLHRTYQKILVTTSTHLKFSLGLEKDTIYSNMQIASFGIVGSPDLRPQELELPIE